MHIQLSAKVINQAEVLKQLHGLTGPQAARAYAKALNDVGFEIRRAMQDEMRVAFDRPTSYIIRSPRVRMAKPDRLSVTIEPSDMGRNGVHPQKILNAQTWGGRRRDKRSEVSLLRSGLLPPGFQVVIPEIPFPGSDDGRGNLKGRFLAHLIAYFSASGEQGYAPNMTDKRKRSIHRGSKRSSARRYFLSYGAMRGQHLAAGIWAASGTGGADVRPVLMFVKQGTYQPRLDMNKVAQRADAEAYLARRIRFRLREAAGV